MIAALLAPFRWLLVTLAAGLATWVAGRHYQSSKAKTEALRQTLDAFKTREAIENEIDQDVDLVRRAHAAGVVRHTEH